MIQKETERGSGPRVEQHAITQLRPMLPAWSTMQALHFSHKTQLEITQ